jgi:superfamily II DNA or RNA helicase
MTYPYRPADKSVKDFLFQDMLYNDQVLAVKSLLNYSVAQAVDPTGMGKSLIAGAIMCIRMEERSNPGVFSMTSPTKVLGEQLLLSQVLLMAACGIKKVAVMCVNSDPGQPFLNREQRRFIQKATGVTIYVGRNDISRIGISEFISNAHNKGFHVLLSSTYHSMHRILEALSDINGRIDVHVNDEPQKLVTDSFKDLVDNEVVGYKELDDGDIDTEKFVASIHRFADRMYSVTATPRTTYDADGIGMQNFDRFGPVVFEMSERECYELGRKVPPRLARLTGLDFEITGAKSMGMLVKKAFEQFDIRWSKHELRAKVLIDTAGSKEIRWFADSQAKQDLINQGINVAHCDSCNGYWINNERFDTIGEWRNRLVELPEDQPLIVLHIQMLVEGLDVPGFNSLLLTRTRDKSPLKQLIGRIQRLLGIDRDMMGYGQAFKSMSILKKSNAKKLIKPYALVAVLEQRRDVYAFLSQTVNIMRSDYGIEWDQIADWSEWRGEGEEHDTDGDQRERKDNRRDLERFLKDQYNARLVEETEKEMYGDMTAIQKVLHRAKINADWLKQKCQ